VVHIVAITLVDELTAFVLTSVVKTHLF